MHKYIHVYNTYVDYIYENATQKKGKKISQIAKKCSRLRYVVRGREVEITTFCLFVGQVGVRGGVI